MLAGGAAVLGGSSAMVAACGGPGGGNQAAAPAGPVTIEFSFWGDQKLVDTFAKDIADFNKTSPNIQVKTIHMPTDYYTKLETLIVGGTPPDISMLANSSVPEFAAKGTLSSLDSQIKKNANVDDLYPSVREALKYKGVFYGLPRDVTTFALFYNQQLFDEAGVKYPDASWTWNSLLDAAKRITKAGPGIDNPVYGFHHRPLFDQTQTWIWQNGGDFLNKDGTAALVDQPAATEALQWLADLRTVQRVAPLPNALGTEDQGKLFSDRKIAMYINGFSSGITFSSVQGLRFDVAAVPQGKARATVLVPIMYVEPKGTKAPDAAFSFMKFLAGAQGQRNHAALGAGFPGYRSVAESDVFLKNDTGYKSKKVFLDMLAYARPIDSPPALSRMIAVFTEQLAPVWKGERTAKEATAEMKRQIDPLLK
jgi:multiple sugar transport system substrate-binding protein